MPESTGIMVNVEGRNTFVAISEPQEYGGNKHYLMNVTINHPAFTKSNDYGEQSDEVRGQMRQANGRIYDVIREAVAQGGNGASLSSEGSGAYRVEFTLDTPLYMLDGPAPVETAIRGALEATKRDPAKLGSVRFDNPPVQEAALQLLADQAKTWSKVRERRMTGEYDYTRLSYNELVVASDLRKYNANRPELIEALNQLFLDLNINALARPLAGETSSAGYGLVVEVKHPADYEALRSVVNAAAKRQAMRSHGDLASGNKGFDEVDRPGFTEGRARH